VLVVRTAQDADPVRSVETRSCETVAMIELKGASLGAPAAALVGERAAASVALEDLALDCIGNVTRRQVIGLLVPVWCTCPERTTSKITGKRRAARARWIRV
jgi:hypothetical protein